MISRYWVFYATNEKETKKEEAQRGDFFFALIFALVVQEKTSDCAGSYTNFLGSTVDVLSGESRVGRN